MAISEQQQLSNSARASSTKSASHKHSARSVLGSVLKHLAPQVEVDGSSQSKAANHAFVYMARSH